MKMMLRRLSLFIVMAVIVQCISFFGTLDAHAASSLKIQMFNNVLTSQTNSISPYFRIINNGTAPINLSDVKVRYYYTIDHTSAINQNYWCDWSSVGSNNITGRFVAITNSSGTADRYFELGFTSGAGNLAMNGAIDVQIRFSKADWSSYNQTNDYSFNQRSSSYADCSKVTGYLGSSRIWGVEPVATSPSPSASPSPSTSPSPSPTARKFLIVVSKPLYDYGFGIMKGHLSVYQEDLRAEGWDPRIITVDNTNQTNPEYTCSNPDALKTVIKSFFEDDYQGFVLIGSHPNIQTAFWTYDQGISSHNIPTDLFYADMSDWGSVDSDGAYVPYPENPSRNILRNFAPDMIYGRISSGCITDTINEEAGRLIAYLNKIHNYRKQGSNLSNEELNRSLVLREGNDFKRDKAPVSFLNQATSYVYGLFDDSLTTPDRLETELEKGYKFYYQTIHSFNDYHDMTTWSNNTPSNVNYTYARVTDPSNRITPKVHYLNLASCFACQYNGINVTSSGPVVEDRVNIGAAYLFNSDYVLNVTGQTGGWGLGLSEEYYEQLANGTPIGQAFRDFIANLINNNSEVGCPKGILLGDPTLRYTEGAPNNIAPRITTNLTGEKDESNLLLYAGTPFTIHAEDPDLTSGRNDSISIELSGNDTESETMLSTANITRDNQSLIWTPSASAEGKTYNLTVRAYNRDANNNIVNNGYTENFTVTIASRTYEAELSRNTLSGGAVVADDSTCSDGKKVGMLGNNSGELTLNNVFARYTGRYTIRVRYKTANNREAFVSVNNNTGVPFQFVGLGNWTAVGSQDIQVNLNQGYNTIRFFNPNINQWAPDIDNIEIMGSYQAEHVSNSLRGDAIVEFDMDCVGRRMVSNIGFNTANGEYGSLSINGIFAPTSGNYTLRVHYISPENRTANISVNNEASRPHNFAATGTSVDVRDIPIQLDQGYENSIEFANWTAWAPQIDYIEIINN